MRVCADYRLQTVIFCANARDYDTFTYANGCGLDNGSYTLYEGRLVQRLLNDSRERKIKTSFHNDTRIKLLEFRLHNERQYKLKTFMKLR